MLHPNVTAILTGGAATLTPLFVACWRLQRTSSRMTVALINTTSTRAFLPHRTALRSL
jgi:hypothetical protein